MSPQAWAVLILIGMAWVSIARHEISHAVVALMCGADVTAVRVWPHLYQGWFYFGRVQYSGLDPNDRDAVLVAPYLVDAMCIVSWYLAFPDVDVSTMAIEPLWHWALHCLLLITPAVDLGYNIVKAIVWRRGDLYRLAGGM